MLGMHACMYLKPLKLIITGWQRFSNYFEWSGKVYEVAKKWVDSNLKISALMGLFVFRDKNADQEQKLQIWANVVLHETLCFAWPKCFWEWVWIQQILNED